MSWFSDNIEFLKDSLLDSACSKVKVYSVGGTLINEFDAVLAKSEVHNKGDAGQEIYQYLFDVLVPHDAGYYPKRQDTLVIDGDRYVIVPTGTELYRWDDPYHTMLRIHIQKEGSDDSKRCTNLLR